MISWLFPKGIIWPELIRSQSFLLEKCPAESNKWPCSNKAYQVKGLMQKVLLPKDNEEESLYLHHLSFLDSVTTFPLGCRIVYIDDSIVRCGVYCIPQHRYDNTGDHPGIFTNNKYLDITYLPSQVIWGVQFPDYISGVRQRGQIYQIVLEGYLMP